MAIPAREALVKELQATLGDIPVSYDDGSKGIWQNRVDAMLMFDPAATYHCVLQDDTIPCTNFFEEVEKLCTEDKAYCLYFGNRRNMRGLALEAEKAGRVELDWMHWGVAIVVPTRVIHGIVRYWHEHAGYERNDDTRIGKYLRSIGMPIVYPVPTLVDHRHEVKSSMENTEGPQLRKSHLFKN